MKLLYEQEINSYLTQSCDEIVSYANSLIESENAINWQKASELSFLLRRNNRHDEAVVVSQMLFEKDPTIDKLNLYFVAVVDQASIAKVKELHNTVSRYVKEHGDVYQKHLFATWLKAANRIQDDAMFEYVYSLIPSSEKVENSYIISQYYVYLNRHSRYKDVIKHYEDDLPISMQQSFYVKKYYNNAYSRMNGIIPFTNGGLETKKIEASNLETDDSNNQKEKRVFLVYGNNPPELGMIKYVLKSNNIHFTDLSDEVDGRTILQKFEKFASGSNFAIVLLTPSDKVLRKDPNGNEMTVYYPRQNVVLEWGYFLAKLSSKNIAVLLQEQGRTVNVDFIVPSDIAGVEYISMSENWMKKLLTRLQSSGFPVNAADF